MINLNIDKHTSPAVSTKDFSAFASMPKLNATSILLTDLHNFFEDVEQNLDVVNVSNETIKILEPAEHYIMLHGLNRTALSEFSASLESVGVDVKPEDYKATLDSAYSVHKDAYVRINDALQTIRGLFDDADIFDRWNSVMATACAKAKLGGVNIKSYKFKLDPDKYISGVNPTVFKHQVDMCNVILPVLNSEHIDFTKPVSNRFRQALTSLEKMDTQCDTVLNLSWSLEDVRKLDEYVQNYLVPNTLRFSQLAKQIRNGCTELLKKYDANVFRNMKDISFAAYRVTEISARLLCQYNDLTK